MQEQCWVYETDGHPLYYDKGEWVCIRIEAEEFYDNAPPKPSERANPVTLERKSPYSITVRCLDLRGETANQS
jgi:RNA polymerase III subunit Rpc25